MAWDLMWFLGGTGTALLLGLFAVLIYKNKIKTHRKDMYAGVLAVLGIIAFISGMGVSAVWEKISGVTPVTLAVGGEAAAPAETGVITYQQTGSQSTITINAFTGTWSGASSKTEVWPRYTIFNSVGNILNDDVNVNSTTVATGDKISVYGTGSIHYLKSVKNWDVSNDRPTLELEAYPISARTDLAITAYDNTGSTALKAHPNASVQNAPDYNTSDLGAGQNEVIYVKIQNKVADKVFDLGLVCVGYSSGQEIDDATITSVDSVSSGLPSITFNKAAGGVPKGLVDATIYGNVTATVYSNIKFVNCYEPSQTLRLNEWDWIKYQVNIDTNDATAPDNQGDSYIVITHMDTSNHKDITGNIAYSPYTEGDSTEDAGAVGCDENPETTSDGLNAAIKIEVV